MMSRAFCGSATWAALKSGPIMPVRGVRRVSRCPVLLLRTSRGRSRPLGTLGRTRAISTRAQADSSTQIEHIRHYLALHLFCPPHARPAFSMTCERKAAEIRVSLFKSSLTLSRSQ
jgi:hypothetical protein